MAVSAARQVDWNATELGPPDHWPTTLKTTLATIFRARQPMFLWWGKTLIQFYNDAYLPSFGHGKHPRAMGQAGRECWTEIWPIIGPQIEGVMARGEPTWHEDALVPIYRNGRIEDVYWTYTYSPVFDEHGTVAGTLVICTETTNRVLSERRTRALQQLVATTANATNPTSLMEMAACALERADRDILAVTFCKRQGEHQKWATTRDGFPGTLLDVCAGMAGPQQAASEWEAQVVDLEPGSSPPQADPQHDASQRIYVAPLARDDAGTDMYLACALSTRLPLDERYREFLDQVVAHLRAALARVREAERRRAIELERRNLLEQAPVATAILVGPEHVFELANPLYRQMVGRPQILGKTYLQAFPELADTPLPEILDRVYRTGQPFATSELKVMVDKGSGTPEEGFYRFALQPVRDLRGDVYGMMVIALEVTDQVTARKTMEKAHAERERLLHHLENAMRAKDEFLAMLGHELRNPLAPIATALQLIKRRSQGPLLPELSVIERQVKHLTRLVDDLLDVARIARGKVELRPQRADVADILAEAVEIVSTLLETRGHHVSIDCERGRLSCDVDRVRISQVVSNLLSNAARYTPNGGHIAVRAHAEGNEVVIVVEDDGRGIAPEMLPRVFTLFEQGERSSDRTEGGLGIGLALVKNLVQLHGGSVAVHSDGLGKGSSFTVRLPAATQQPSPAHEAHETPATTISRRPQRVLVVDDNVDAAHILESALSAHGHITAVATDAASALEVAARFAPDVGILDIGLPVMDGYELASHLRQLAGCRDCRLFALTGYGREHDRRRSTEAGFEHHLVKPIATEVLLELIDAAPPST